MKGYFSQQKEFYPIPILYFKLPIMRLELGKWSDLIHCLLIVDINHKRWNTTTASFLYTNYAVSSYNFPKFKIDLSVGEYMPWPKRDTLLSVCNVGRSSSKNQKVKRQNVNQELGSTWWIGTETNIGYIDNTFNVEYTKSN